MWETSNIDSLGRDRDRLCPNKNPFFRIGIDSFEDLMVENFVWKGPGFRVRIAKGLTGGYVGLTYLEPPKPAANKDGAVGALPYTWSPAKLPLHGVRGIEHHGAAGLAQEKGVFKSLFLLKKPISRDVICHVDALPLPIPRD